MELFDFQKQKMTTVPDTDVTDAIVSGRFGLQKGTKLPVVTADGRRGLVPAEKAFEAFASGFARFETLEEQKQAALREQVNSRSGILMGSAAALARGLTLGLSDVLLTAGDSPGSLERKAFLAAYRDEHPTSSLAFDIVGAVAPAFFTGGGSLLARGGVQATRAGVRSGVASSLGSAMKFTPAGLAMAAGRQVEGAIARNFAGQTAASAAQRSIASKVAPRAIGSALEGAAFATGGVISEHTLGDTELTAESLVAGVGFGALLGAGAGGALALPGALGGRAASKARQEFRASAEKVRTRVQELQTAANKARGPEADSLRAEAQKLVDELSGKMREAARVPNPQSKFYTPDDISPFTSTERMAAFAGGIEKEKARYFLRNRANVQGAPTSASMLDVAEDALIRPETGLRATKSKILDAAEALLPRAQNQFNIGNYGAYLNRRIEELSRRGFTDQSRSPAIKMLRKEFEDLKKSHRILNKNVPLTSVREQLLTLRRNIPPASKIGKSARAEMVREMEKIDTFFNSQIKNDPIIGQQYSAYMREAQKLIRVEEQIEKLIQTQDPGRIMRVLAKEFDGSIAPRFNADGVPNDLQSLVDLAPFIRWNGQNMSFSTLFKNRILKEELQINGALATSAADEAQKQFLTFVAGSTVGATLVAAAARVGTVRAATKFARGRAFQAITDPADNIYKQTFAKLRNLEGFRKKIEDKVRGGARNFAGASQGITVPRVTAPLSPSTIKTLQEFQFRGDRKFESANEAAAALSNQLSEIAASPTHFSGMLADRLAEVQDVAPETSFHTMQAIQRAIGFLNEVSPKNPYEGRLVQRQWIPTDRQTQDFANYVAAVQNPMQAIDDFEAGVMTPQQAEVLARVYPAIYQFIRDVLIDEIGERPLKPNLQNELMLSLLLGMPVSAGVDPAFILRMQQYNEPTDEQQGQGPGGLRFQGLDNISKDKSKETESERIMRGIE